MSANRLTVACWTAVSEVGRASAEWLLSRPHAHWTVPAPKTRAPLGARYIVRWWVAVPGA